jgi:hypothetical protein
MTSPIERLIDSANLRCTACGTPKAEGCDCWVHCSCGYSYPRDGECQNPATRRCTGKLPRPVPRPRCSRAGCAEHPTS